MVRGGGRRTKKLVSSPALEDGVSSLPDHRNNRAADHVVDQTSEESLAGEVGVVLLHELTGGRPELHGDELVALRMKRQRGTS